MDAILNQIKDFASTADEVTLRQIPLALRDLAISLETPHDTLLRVVYQPFELMVAKVALDLDLFKLLVSTGRALSLIEIASATGADHILLRRILRHLASFRFIAETAEDTYEASHVTHTFARPGYDDSIWFHFNFFNNVIQATPQFLSDNGYKDISEPLNCPVQVAMNTKLDPYVWVRESPDYLKRSVPTIAAQLEGRGDWTSAINFRDDCKQRIDDDETSKHEALFVDIGAGTGVQTVRFAQVADGIPGRIIYEDLESTLPHAMDHPRVEKIVHDFFQPQIVKGAKYYYLRNILHDYGDEKSVILLRHLKDAMSADSVILINDIVLPNVGVPRQAANCDLAMMISLAALERTERQWTTLLESAGLSIRKLTIYDNLVRDSLIEAVIAH